MSTKRLRVGTRGSPLAVKQAEEVRRRLADAHQLNFAAFEICIIKTSGDRIQDRALQDFGGKGLFTKEIEEALLSGEIDMAVHSMKDMPTVLPQGLEIACLLPREDVRDAFISLTSPDLASLPAGACVGTASLRRQAQIKRLRPDLNVVMFRGNVQTRLRKLTEKQADATLLAAAGLRRLGETARITSAIAVDEMLPAVAQGAIGIEIRSSDETMRTLLQPINHASTEICLAAERAFLAGLDGSCRTPIAGLATLEHRRLCFRGEILLPDGSEYHAIERQGDADDALALGDDAAAELRSRAGEAFFERLLA